MHILFAHKSFPAQFRHIMTYLVAEHGAECTFVSEKSTKTFSTDVNRIQYKPRRVASNATSYFGRSHETQMWRSQAIVESLAEQPDLQPDLVVAHSGFFTSSFFRELYDCPIVNLFEYYYHPTDSDCDFRSDLLKRNIVENMKTRVRNSVFLLDLENCDLGYCPTEWQRSRFPDEFQGKLTTAHDGIDTDYWTPLTDSEGRSMSDQKLSQSQNLNQKLNQTLDFELPNDVKVITYVTRGFESMRGFDIFMKFAKRICDLRDDVVFLVAGSDHVSYGADRQFTGGLTFKDWVLQQDDYDLQRIRFMGHVSRDVIRDMYRRSDLHVYLTAPFVISWSPLEAMSAGCLLLGSDTEPVREVIQHQHNGLLADFFDVEQMVELAMDALDNADAYLPVRNAARQTVEQQFSLSACLPQLAKLYQTAGAVNSLAVGI